ncbi:MAG TPA: hypothetical protein VFM79_09005 [Pelobium sp.]|nr:hypothetical protein [Pelobium sp.]
MKILIACEESQTVCKAFREKGHEAYSCDIQECSGDHPEWHIKDDVLEVLKGYWDMVISFQPCTDLTVSGARWFKEKRKSGSQEQGIRFFFEVWKKSNCSENPIGILNGGNYIKDWFPNLHDEMKSNGFPFKPSQIIHPWMFGHGETKATCLWLKGLPKLEPTNIVEGREGKVWKMPPGPDRAKLRSKTYEGIASAMAEQWG